MITLYGIKTCDTCRKALKALSESGHEVSFRDVRTMPLDAAELRRLLDAFGPALLNTRSTTWRGLSEEDRQQDPEALLATHPTLMKRPVIEGPSGLTLGWTKDAAATHLE